MMRIMLSWKNQAGYKIGYSYLPFFSCAPSSLQWARRFLATHLDYQQSKWGIDKCAQKQYNTDTVKEGSEYND